MTHDTLQLNQLTEVFSVEGAASFVAAFIKNFKQTFATNNVWEVNLKNATKICSAEIIIAKSLYSTEAILADILKSAEMALADASTSLDCTNTVIRSKNYTFTFTSDVVEAIRQQAEITYIVNGKLAKKLSPKNIARAENLFEYFYDTCCTYYENKSLITDRYYFTCVKQPLPIKEIVQLCTGVNFILEQFNQVIELNCTLRATGITRN